MNDFEVGKHIALFSESLSYPEWVRQGVNTSPNFYVMRLAEEQTIDEHVVHEAVGFSLIEVSPVKRGERPSNKTTFGPVNHMSEAPLDRVMMRLQGPFRAANEATPVPFDQLLASVLEKRLVRARIMRRYIHFHRQGFSLDVLADLSPFSISHDQSP